MGLLVASGLHCGRLDTVRALARQGIDVCGGVFLIMLIKVIVWGWFAAFYCVLPYLLVRTIANSKHCDIFHSPQVEEALTA